MWSNPSMAGYRKKVQQWQDAGLISADQANAIVTWEQDKKSGKFGRGLVGVGIFAILTGILSIIASNWEVIPASVKIGAHLLLNAGVAAVAWRAARDGKDMIREGAALAFFFLTLTFMVLIGQTYQLDGSKTGLTVTWMIATLPFIAFFGKQYMTAIAWILSFVTVVCIVLHEQLSALSDFWGIFCAICVGTLLPLIFIGGGLTKMFQRVKPIWADVFVRTGFFFLALNASVATFAWYEKHGRISLSDLAQAHLSYSQGYLIYVSIFIVALLGILAMAFHHGFYRDNEPRRQGMGFAVVSILLMAFPVIIPEGESGLLAALSFIGYWIYAGWVGQQLAWSRLISLAIVLVTIRIFSIYLEVFGTLLATGYGLVVGGAVLLGLIALARRMNKKLTGKEAAHG